MFAARRTVRAARILTPLAPIGEKATIGRFGLQGDGKCFIAPSREAVDAFHAAGLEAGGVDEGAPGPRPDYGPGYYGAFLRDPEGHKVEAAIVPGASRRIRACAIRHADCVAWNRALPIRTRFDDDQSGSRADCGLRFAPGLHIADRASKVAIMHSKCTIIHFTR